MDAQRLRRPPVLLTQHFLRQFLDNDLVSPDADRSQTLAVVGAMAISVTLFISVVMSFAYVMGSLTPGQGAVISLTDKLFYLSFAMVVSALVAASQWDALSVDPRDAATLEPLPIEAATIRRAKLTAIGILGGAVAVLINLFPSVVFPWLLVFNYRQMSLFTMLGLMVANFVLTVGASAFGYLAVVAIRETLAALLGLRWFTRVAPWAQGLLIVALGGSLLLLPSMVTRAGYQDPDGWRALTPPMWFLGVYEMAAGGAIADLPRPAMTRRQIETDTLSAARYEQWRARFPALARRAAVAVPLVVVIAVVAYLWNARRMPSLAPLPPPAWRRPWRFVEQLANATLVRDPSARAGFYFALAAMWRSNAHRITLASAAAAGFAMSVLALSNATIEPGRGASVRLLAAQPLLYGALLVGFRHAIRVPAELRANWGFQLAWRNHERAFVAGVRRAALVALALPALLLVLPLYLVTMGPMLAAQHLLLGFAGAAVVLEALMAGYDKVPFTCTYLPSDNMKALGPIYVIAFVIGASLFARMEHDALFGDGPALAVVTLGILFVGFRMSSLRRSRPSDVEFDEAPATYQELRLHT